MRDRACPLALGGHAATRSLGAVMLHFAYGSNMSRALMGVRCPGATALGTATLDGWRFVIGVDAYASVVRQPGGDRKSVV